MKENKGITLIALVITIVVLLILAGVTLNIVLDPKGLIGKANEAQKKTKYATYLEEVQFKNTEAILNNTDKISAIGENIKNYIGIEEKDIENFAIVDGNLIYIGTNAEDIEIVTELGIMVKSDVEEVKVLKYVTEIVNKNGTKQGKELIDRTVNSSYWAIVTEIEDNKVSRTYGTEYYYIEKGTEIDGSVLANSYVINYNNKSVISCKETEKKSYTYLDINSSLGVTENLILNLDAKNISNSENWGEGIELYKYDDTTYPSETLFANAPTGYDRVKVTDMSSYLNNNAFVFNGNNYIEIYNEDTFDFSEGLTFEFYGKIQGNAGPFKENYPSSLYTGLFGMWDGNNKVARIRFGTSGLKLQFNFASSDKNVFQEGSHSIQGSPWNQLINISEKWNEGEKIYFSITLSKPKSEGENAEFKIYINGEKYIDNGWINNAYWNKFLNEIENYNLNYLDIGRCTMSEGNPWSYLKGETYTMRLYNNYLTEDEINENYNKTLSYIMTENNK